MPVSFGTDGPRRLAWEGARTSQGRAPRVELARYRAEPVVGQAHVQDGDVFGQEEHRSRHRDEVAAAQVEAGRRDVGLCGLLKRCAALRHARGLGGHCARVWLIAAQTVASGGGCSLLDRSRVEVSLRLWRCLSFDPLVVLLVALLVFVVLRVLVLLLVLVVLLWACACASISFLACRGHFSAPAPTLSDGMARFSLCPFSHVLAERPFHLPTLPVRGGPRRVATPASGGP